jgi:hypothetical protein
VFFIRKLYNGGFVIKKKKYISAKSRIDSNPEKKNPFGSTAQNKKHFKPTFNTQLRHFD